MTDTPASGPAQGVDQKLYDYFTKIVNTPKIPIDIKDNIKQLIEGVPAKDGKPAVVGVKEIFVKKGIELTNAKDHPDFGDPFNKKLLEETFAEVISTLTKPEQKDQKELLEKVLKKLREAKTISDALKKLDSKGVEGQLHDVLDVLDSALKRPKNTKEFDGIVKKLQAQASLPASSASLAALIGDMELPSIKLHESTYSLAPAPTGKDSRGRQTDLS